MKVRSRKLIIACLCLMMITIPYISPTANNIKNLIIEVLISFWLLTRHIKTRVVKNNRPIILFVFTMVFCTFINLFLSSRLVNALVTGYSYVLIFFVIDYFMIKKQSNIVMFQIFKVVFLFALVELVAIIASNGQGIGSNSVLKNYILGNKFFVSYTHMFLLALLYELKGLTDSKKIRILIYLFGSIYSIIICHVVDCNTGIIGSVSIIVFCTLMRIHKTIHFFLAKPIVFILFFVGSTFLLVGTDIIINNSFFQELFYKYSHTNAILTGRLEMFDIAISAIFLKPFWGYGINSTIVSDTLSWGNAQNGLLKNLLDYGLIGTFALLFLCYDSLKCSYIKKSNFGIGLLGFLYSMALCSTVEINIGFLFFFGLALLKYSQSDLEQ